MAESGNETYTVMYEYNDNVYTILGTREMHTQFANDMQSFLNYIHPPLENSVTETVSENIDHETTEQLPSKKPFTWNKTTTMLLISCYKERAEDFRNPKIKKRGLWLAIRDEFATKGHEVTEDDLDRKWRNLKKTYTTILDNKKTTGRGRISWDYLEDFETIYANDKALNLPKTISSNKSFDLGPSTSQERVIPAIPCVSLPSTSQSGVSSTGTQQQAAGTATDKGEMKGARNKALYQHRKLVLDL